jgi:hypothetical protein
MKKLTAIILTVAMVLSLSIHAGAEPYRKGDVDGDGEVTISDALEILKYLAKMDSTLKGNPEALSAGNTSNDGNLPTISDVLEILKKLAKMPNLIDNPKMPVGNTSANIFNSGIAAIQGEWIYYRNVSDSGKLYKMKTDGTEKVKLSDDSAYYINVIGDYVYYNGWDSKSNRLYKIKTDGTERIALNDVNSWYVNVIGDWVYYMNANDSAVYRMKTDGTGNKKLIDNCRTFSIVNDWIYYQRSIDSVFWSELGEDKLCKMRTDGTNNQVVVDEYFSHYLRYVDNNLIYQVADGKADIIIGDINGNEVISLYCRTYSNNSVRNWLYFAVSYGAFDDINEVSNDFADKGLYKVNINELKGLVIV